MRFTPNTDSDREVMCRDIGITQAEELFDDIPKKLVLKNKLNLPPPLSEPELKQVMKEISEMNNHSALCFRGAGAYNHYIPSVVNHIISKPEFYTAYTPYQPEISQGILQAIYEYQTLICELTKMDAANASMYDGASSLAEAALMCLSINRRKKIIVSKTVHPEYRAVLKTYLSAKPAEITEVEYADGATSLDALKKEISENTSAVLIQNPNFFGIIEDMDEISRICHENNALLVVCTAEPTSMGLLKPPGEYNADIAVGEAQSFGNPLNFGGPSLGFMATKNEFVRKLPGRIAGMTNDTKNRRGFVLTLQTREQHIRRERATSNICTNEALCALAATVYLAMLSTTLRELSEHNLQKAHYMQKRLIEAGCDEVFKRPFYNEFILKHKSAEKVEEKCLEKNIIPGLRIERFYPELKDTMLWCVTELCTKEQIDRAVSLMSNLNKK